MDTLLKCSSCMPSVTYIFNTFIDDYMIAANGSYVKVYLFLCKCIQSGDTNISVSTLADMMDNTENDIIRALKYWEKNELIYISRDMQNGQMTGIELLNPATASKSVRNLNILPSSQNNNYKPNNINIQKNTTYTQDDTTNIQKNTTYTQNNNTNIQKNTTYAQDDNANIQKNTTYTQDDNANIQKNTTYIQDNTNTQKNSTYTANNFNTSANEDIAEEPALSKDNNINVSQKPVINNADLNKTTIKENSASKNMDTQTTHETDSQIPDNNQSNIKSETHIEINITKEQTKRLADNTEFNWICRVIEKYLAHPLSSKELQLISYLYDNLNFSVDLLLHLYEYCISLGKTNVNYIQAVAISWDEQNVKTPEEAKAVSVSYNSAHTSISKALALSRPLAVIEKQFVQKWLNEWNMDLSVVLDACSRTMLKLQKADFKYTDGILDNWHKKNVHTLQDVKKEDEVYAKNKSEQKKSKAAQKTATLPQNKNQFNSFQQRGTSKSDVDELEQKLLKRG